MLRLRVNASIRRYRGGLKSFVGSIYIKPINRRRLFCVPAAVCVLLHDAVYKERKYLSTYIS